MSRYIVAEDLKMELIGWETEPTDEDIERVIDNMPTADVAPVVHGRWLTWEEQFPGEMTREKSRLGVFCSACHNHADNMFDFCPNCGCRMDGEDGEPDGTI